MENSDLVYLIGITLMFFISFRLWVSAFAVVTGYNIVSLYLGNLKKTGLYGKYVNYHDLMVMSFDEHLFSFDRWGRYSAIRKEYMEILTPYIHQ